MGPATSGPTYRFVARNNVWNQSGWKVPTGMQGLAGAKFHNNTCYSTTNHPHRVLCIDPRGAAECYNNVALAPAFLTKSQKSVINTGDCVVKSTNYDDGKLDNLTQGGADLFEEWTPTGLVGATPKAGSQLIDAGTDVPTLFDDALGNPRTGTFDAGAVERQ